MGKRFERNLINVPGPRNHVLVGDEAFALKLYLMRPFPTDKPEWTFGNKTTIKDSVAHEESLKIPLPYWPKYGQYFTGQSKSKLKLQFY